LVTAHPSGGRIAATPGTVLPPRLNRQPPNAQPANVLRTIGNLKTINGQHVTQAGQKNSQP